MIDPPAPSGPEPAAPTGPEPLARARIVGVAAGLFAAIAMTYLVPPLASFRPWAPGGSYVPFWNLVGRELLGEGDALEREAEEVLELQRKAQESLTPRARPPSSAAASGPPPVGSAEPTSKPVFPRYTPEMAIIQPRVGIEPPSALDAYFRKLTLVNLGIQGAIARATLWGDSVVGADGITSGIRRRLQSHFGDAGHGFHLMDRYNPSYRQQGVEFLSGLDWRRCLIMQGCSRTDSRYGYGGLIVESNGGSWTTWRTPEDGFGQIVSRFEVWYARQEAGGDVEIWVPGEGHISFSTRGPELEDAWFVVRVPPGSHTFKVRSAGNGEVRAYGVVLENDGPGVVWDGISLIGASIRAMRNHNLDHLKSQVRHRDPDLIAFMFGGNDMWRERLDSKTAMQDYREEYSDVVRRFRAGKPEASCLILSLIDHGRRGAQDQIESRPFAKVLSRAQREIALQNGCGFFDTYEAMGGKGSVARWYRARPQLMSGDLGHPTGSGHEVIAGLFIDALLHGYQDYRKRMEGAPLPELSDRPGLAGLEDAKSTDAADD